MTITATAGIPREIRPHDFLDVDRLLDDEERDIRDTVRAFVADRGRPDVGDWFEEATIPLELAPELGKLGVLGMHLEGYGCAGASATAYGLACLELEAGDSGRAQPRLGPGLAGDVRDPPLGLGGAEAGVAAADGGGRGDRLLRADRARRRLGSRLDAHPRAPRRRRLDPARAEDVDHQRLGGRGRGGVGADRRGRPRLPRPARAPRASPPRTSTRSSRCARRSPRSCCSTTCACRPTPLLPEASSLRGPLSCLNEARYGIVWGAVGAARACFEAALEYAKERVAVRPADRRLPDPAAQAGHDGAGGQPGAAAGAAPRADEGRGPAAPRAREHGQAGQRQRGARRRPHRPPGARRQRRSRSSTR